MLAHSKTCYNAEQVSTSTTENVEGHVSSSPSLVKFDQERCHRELVKMLIVMELPFRLVEHKAFIKFSSILQPRFNVTSHAILTHDILTLWDIEKIKLKNFLSQHCQRVCLTTDAWTSNQNLSYIDVLAIPVITVASESTFNSGGRVLDPYHNSLTPKMVEALICTQDWLNGAPSLVFTNEVFEEIKKFEEEMFSSQDIAYAASLVLDEE
ncbi:hypothetical protein JHK82_012131 [Glycine max]|uniref:Putative AC transposase n=1 Tax=Glycine soja TaxID=3848 RepID=A0A0B2P1F8_GLYSO|nr:hypothetical protein JHK85_012458 [Glycine max]KAG5057132.1 hypothetical protein JHK86_012128 [Glycine max]KAG5154162.1 hypothetical protein JHK82_012131 [Glycine max]KHN01532.1 Putative AC transposase [Glycine soja]